MAITAAQLAARSKFLGSSDAAAVLGFSPWRTAADVRLEKLGMLEPEPAGELAEIGTALESGIADLAGRRLGVTLIQPPETYMHTSGVLGANLDRQIERAARGQPLVEVKDSGLDEDWGEPGTGQVPPYVACQVCHQLLCSDATEAHVARLGRGWKRGLFLYQLATTDENVARLIEVMAKFLPIWWQKHIVNRDPLPEKDPPPSMEALKRIRREPKSVAVVPSDIYLAAHKARAARLAADKTEEEAVARLLAKLEMPDGKHAEGFECPEGTGTYLEQSRKGYTVQPTSFRVLRMKINQG